MVRKSENKVMSNNPTTIRQVYMEHKTQFAHPNNEQTAKQMIVNFFSPVEFLKRLNLHREHICKSKTKRQQPLRLYFVEV